MTLLELIEKETNHTYRREGRNYRGPCPFCGGNSRFTINNEKDMFKCWVCDQGGNQIWFVRRYKKMSKSQASDYLGLPNEAKQPSRKIGDHLPTERPKVLNEPQSPPETQWSEQAWHFIFQCQPRLMGEAQGQGVATSARRQG